MEIQKYIYNYDYNAITTAVYSSASVFALYPIVKIYLHHNYENFNLLPSHKQYYVVKNLIKSSMLLGLCIMVIPTIVVPVYMNGTWSNYWCHRLGILYTTNDYMGLLLVDKLPKTTQDHHKITTILCVISLGIDFQTSTLGQMLFVYTIASASSYLVNFYLGARLLCKEKQLQLVRSQARNIYFVSCLVNWGWHIHWCIRNYDLLYLQHLLYFLFLTFIIKDDIILLGWLNK